MKNNGCRVWELLDRGMIAAIKKKQLYSSDKGLQETKMGKVGAGFERVNQLALSFCCAPALLGGDF